ncbi:MAG: flagellar basal body P-ring protein FlgI [Acidobacteriota bacterium]|nr:MAG: flagellar basal body P-ring protein FlgI [Acidobacteriota bacterium]
MTLQNQHTKLLIAALAAVALLAVASATESSVQVGGASVPLRDIVDVYGVRDNQLVGYGLVVGLAGTGDGTQAKFTIQSLANALRRMGVVVPPAAIRVRNAAAVMVTADLPAFARPGTRIDVNVASVGDAKSLTGGTLLRTPLQGPDGRVYALAQGPLSLGGGFTASGGGASVSKNHTTAGTVPAGALVERSVGVDIAGRTTFDLQLREPAFTTAHRIEQALRQAFTDGVARAVDAGTVHVSVPSSLHDRPVEFLSLALAVEIRPDVPARVVLNERTGTVVLGGDVKLSRVAITHGSLTISVAETFAVSQPPPFSQQGETVVVPEGDVLADEEQARSLTVGEGTRVEDLVDALQKIGVTPRDMIAIFEAIRAAGALHAELVVI